jgi:hypothetical protein
MNIQEKAEPGSSQSIVQGRQNVDNQAVSKTVENKITPAVFGARRWRAAGRKRRWNRLTNAK